MLRGLQKIYVKYWGQLDFGIDHFYPREQSWKLYQRKRRKHTNWQWFLNCYQFLKRILGSNRKMNLKFLIFICFLVIFVVQGEALMQKQQEGEIKIKKMKLRSKKSIISTTLVELEPYFCDITTCHSFCVRNGYYLGFCESGYKCICIKK